jgi:predicted dehydrogenase
MTPPATLSRRRFLGASAATALTFGAAPAFAYRPKARILGANEAVTLGFIGVGGMGTGLLNIFKGFEDARVAAVCDIYEPHRKRAAAEAGSSPNEYTEFREILDRKDIDAVVVATPDHWHAIPIILACQAGKDVYGEKPLGYAIGEGRRIVDAAAKHNRVTQMGNLIHASETYHRVAEIIQSGALGRINKARFWMSQRSPAIGAPADTAPPEGLDYNAWLGPAPEHAFNPNRFTFYWRWFWDYGGGLLTDFVCHLYDPICWGMNATAPTSVVATGELYDKSSNVETPDSMEVVWHFPDHGGWDLVFTQAPTGNPVFDGRRAGIRFEGEKGILHAHYGDFKVIAAGDEEIALPEPTLPRSPGHHREWINKIKTREQCSCNFAYGHQITSVGQLGNIALRTGQRLEWDAASERVTNHEPANNYLLRPEYRKPFDLPTV